MKLPALHWQILIAVIVAAATGLVLNATVSFNDATAKLKDGGSVHLIDSSDRVEITLQDANGKPIPGQGWLVDPSAATIKVEYVTASAGAIGLAGVGPLQAVSSLHPYRIRKNFATLDLLKKAQPRAFQLFQKHGRSTARWIGDWSDGVGQLFLRMLKMVSVPLIITSLLTGVLGLASAGRLRKLFGMTIGYYIATSTIAIITGLCLVNLIQPGNRGDLFSLEIESAHVQGELGEVLYGQVEAMIPINPIEAVAQGNFLSIIAFSLAFGVFTLLVGGRPLEVMRGLFQAGFDVMMKMTLAIIHLAPIGVFCLMLAATATQGLQVFITLGWYMLTVFLALFVHATITLPAIVTLIGRRNPLKYAHAMSPALMTAFSSASSNATLPLTLNCVEERAGIDNRVGSFVLPLGATINMDGTALFEVIAVLFIAQLEPGINLTLTSQILVAITALLASIGAAGIPHAGLVMMVIVLSAVGLPADRVGLILAVDRLLDMFRTAVNVWSDSCGCAVVARLDSEITDGGPETEPPTPSIDGDAAVEEIATTAEES